LYDQNLPCLDIVNSIVASFMPFAAFEKKEFAALFEKILLSVRSNATNIPITHTFLTVVMQYALFSDDVYGKAGDVLDVVNYIYDCFGIEQHHLRAVVSRLCGRPSPDKIDQKTIKIAFMVGDRALVTVLEDDSVVVRDSRGAFAWRIAEIKGENLSFAPIEVGELPSSARGSGAPEVEYQPRFADADEVLQQLAEIEGGDTNAQKPFDYRDQPHLQRMMVDPENRCPALNFAIGSGLEIRKIEESVTEIIERFDAIPPVKVEEVLLVHMSESGVTKEDSAQFAWLRKVLGEERNLGMISVKFVEESVAPGPVSLVFNETPFEINLKHEQAPKGRLGIFVRPFDHDRVLLRVQKIDPKVKFWNTFENNRLVHVKRILATVCTIIFRFFMTAAEDDLYEKDAERLACLQAVKTAVPPELELLKPDTFAYA
jgi:hypothetical protein